MTATSPTASRQNGARRRAATSLDAPAVASSRVMVLRRWAAPARPSSTSATTLAATSAPYRVDRADQVPNRRAALTTPEPATSTNDHSARVE